MIIFKISQNKTKMKKITKITKREIFKLFKDGYHSYGISYYDFEEYEFDFLLQNFDFSFQSNYNMFCYN